METSLKTVLYVIGILVSVFGLTMLVPATIDALLGGSDWIPFLESALICLILGGFLILSSRDETTDELRVRDAFFLTLLSWGAAILCGALPLYLARTLSWTDAFFEVTSALTTTGATVISGKPMGFSALTLWLCLLQWLGGIGIVVMALTILPFLKVGGMQLFRMESSDRSEKMMPRLIQVTRSLLFVYVFFTLLGMVALWGVGLSTFDAICHSLSAISTGGLSTSDQSIAFFDNAAMEGVLMALMVFGGAPMLLWIRAWRGSPKTLWADQQFRGYIYVILGSIILCTAWHTVVLDRSFWQTLRHSAFNVISLITTTGYMSEDYTEWSVLSNVLFFFLTFIGGCTGSTSGGIKIFRLQVLKLAAMIQLRRSIHPHGVFVVRYNHQILPSHALGTVMSFFAILAMAYGVLTLGLAMCGLDFMTCLTGAATSLMNVGPGLGPVIGPAHNFAALPDAAKWLIMGGMILGRLEFITVLVLFMPSFWKR